MNDMTLDPVFMAISLVLFLLILILDVLPRFLFKRHCVLLSLVGVGLHIPLMPLMLFAGFTLEWMILAYALSLFAFTTAHYICYAIDIKRKEREEGRA